MLCRRVGILYPLVFCRTLRVEVGTWVYVLDPCHHGRVLVGYFGIGILY